MSEPFMLAKKVVEKIQAEVEDFSSANDCPLCLMVKVQKILNEWQSDEDKEDDEAEDYEEESTEKPMKRKKRKVVE